MRQASARPEERVYGRHAADVYRFALAMLEDRRQAVGVTRAVAARADRELDGEGSVSDIRAWMIDAAHASCRARPVPEPRETQTAPECAEAIAVSREADGLLLSGENHALRVHLGQCLDCEGWARSLRAQRRAFGALALEPAPRSLLL